MDSQTKNIRIKKTLVKRGRGQASLINCFFCITCPYSKWPRDLYVEYNHTDLVCSFTVYSRCLWRLTDVVMSFCPDYPAVQVLHPTQCAQYYDCSNMVNLPNQPAYLNECPYPKLFNADTLRCDDYASVDCGDRIEPLSPCKCPLCK